MHSLSLAPLDPGTFPSHSVDLEILRDGPVWKVLAPGEASEPCVGGCGRLRWVGRDGRTRPVLSPESTDIWIETTCIKGQ